MRLVSSPSFSWLAFFLILLPSAVASATPSAAAEKPKQAWHWLSEADRRQLLHTMQDESSISFELKKKYQRPRPYRAHPEVKALFPVDQYSYPSGHASGSFVLAAVLGELFPDKKSALMARADVVAQSRVIAGVHYPSDIEQGKVLGQAIMNVFLAHAAFQRDLAAAKSEIAAKKSGG
jgi:membrane-associated phospholipid phosphatase